MTSTDSVPQASLYVGDLSSDINEALLFEIFNAVGPVASIRVCRDAVTRMSLGYAYVNFHNAADAEAAIEQMNYSNIGDRPCRIMWSQRDPSLRHSGVGNIFVKNLDKSIDHKALFDTFSVFGRILSCKVATNREGESLGYGFVHYETGEAAQKAIDSVNGMNLADKTVYVGPFIPRKERDPNDLTFTNVYVKNLPTTDFDDEDLEKLFEKFGEITSMMLAKDDEGNPRGFGFVNFEETDDAAKAVEELNESEVQGNTLYVARAMKKEERKKFLTEKFENAKLEKEKKWAGCNLYVKNLADNVDEDILRAGFESYGTIESVRVMIDQATGKSKGFGFVCFSTPEEAGEAMGEMNSSEFEGKPLYVAFAQKKEFRRAQLEAQFAAKQSSKMGAMAAMYPGPGPVYPTHLVSSRPGYGYAPSRRSFGSSPMVSRSMLTGSNQPSGSSRRGRPRGGVRKSGGSSRGAPALGGQLTLQSLANAEPAVQKQIIGERLFPLIKEVESKRAGKITGMLLEMDNADLLGLLESQDELVAKIQEAVDVLNDYETAVDDADDDDDEDDDEDDE